MIEYVKGDILSARTEAIVNTVNTVGVMGKGVALRFKEVFPSNFRAYAQAVKENQVVTGKMFVFPAGGANGVKFIINFPTKEQWYQPSQYIWISEGLKDLVRVIQEKRIQSIALPPLDCGNGKLKWEKVRPMIEEALGSIPGLSVLVFEPDQHIQKILDGESNGKNVVLTPARAMLLQLLFMYEENGEESCLFAAQKLLYFLQRFGEKQLKLTFGNHHYGPYSNQVDHLVYRLQGQWMTGFAEKEAKPFEGLQLRYDRKGELQEYVNGLSPDETNRLKILARFIEGFESPLALEVLATTDSILCKSPQLELPQVMGKIAQWNDRKKVLIKENHVKVAMDRLKRYADVLYPG
jgi:O-acetyl-ADP-ribose deacetylase (regulator of RNase III)